MLISTFLSVILSAPLLHAEVKYVATDYKVIPGSQEEKDWKKCDEISPSYMAELLSFRAISRDLHNLVMGPAYPGRAEEISKMRAELKIHSERLILLAKPEWNYENRHLWLKWTIPGGEFFDPPEPDLGWTKLPPLTKGRFLGHKVGEIKLLGERRPDLWKQTSASTGIGYFRNVEIILNKPATFLEFCQIMRSIEIDFSVEWESDVMKGWIRNQKYKLIFGENL